MRRTLALAAAAGIVLAVPAISRTASDPSAANLGAQMAATAGNARRGTVHVTTDRPTEVVVTVISDDGHGWSRP